MNGIKIMFDIKGKTLLLIYDVLDILNYNVWDTEKFRLSQLSLMLLIGAKHKKDIVFNFLNPYQAVYKLLWVSGIIDIRTNIDLFTNRHK